MSSSMSVNGVKITRGWRERHGRKRHKGTSPQRESMITAEDCEAAARRIARATGSNVILTPEEAARFARNVGSAGPELPLSPASRSPHGEHAAGFGPARVRWAESGELDAPVPTN